MIKSSKGVLKGMGDKYHHPLPPGQSTKVSFLLFPVSLPQTSNTFTCDREKNTSFDSILQRLYLQKKKKVKKKKNLFPGRRQHVEYEPGKLLLIHAKLHSQHRTVFLSVIHPFSGCTYFTFTHTENIHTHPPHFQRIWTLLLVHTPEKHPHFKNWEYIYFWSWILASVVPSVPAFVVGMSHWSYCDFHW